MRKTFIFILLVLLMTGCSSDIDLGLLDNNGNTSDSIEHGNNNSDSEIQNLSDGRFDGEFVYSLFSDALDMPGIESMTLAVITYVFDGTIKAESYSKFLKYTYDDGWRYTSTPTYFVHEMKLDGNKLLIKSWDNSYSEWAEYEYSFENNGYTLILHDYFETTGKDMVLLKQ